MTEPIKLLSVIFELREFFKRGEGNQQKYYSYSKQNSTFCTKMLNISYKRTWSGLLLSVENLKRGSWGNDNIFEFGPLKGG